MNKKQLLIFFISCLTINISAQTTSRLRVESGGTIYFIFNSFDKYENGIVSPIDTRFSIFFNDPLTPALKWKLTAAAQAINIKGTGSNSLDLKTIEMQSSGPIGPLYTAGWLDLTQAPMLIADGGNQTSIGTTTYIVINTSYISTKHQKIKERPCLRTTLFCPR